MVQYILVLSRVKICHNSFLCDIGGGLQPPKSTTDGHKGISEGEDGSGGNCHLDHADQDLS